MKKEGFWSMKRLSKVPEPIRPKVLWDYLCEEMQWLSADFAQERRWKRGVARKVGSGIFKLSLLQTFSAGLHPSLSLLFRSKYRVMECFLTVSWLLWDFWHFV